MKETFKVELTFSGRLTEKQKDKVLSNILDTLVHQVNTAGIVPDSCDSHTETIRVTRSGSNWSQGKNLITGDSIT